MSDRTVSVYQDSHGEWRWRLEAGNGQIIADSGEGYVSRSYAVKMAQEVNPDAVVIGDVGDEISS